MRGLDRDVVEVTSSASQTELGGDDLQERLAVRRESTVRFDGRAYELWTVNKLRDELVTRSLDGRGLRAKSSFCERLRADDRETLAREQDECADCQRVARVPIEGGFAHCDRYRCGLSGPGRGGAGGQPAPVPSAPPVPSASQALSFPAATVAAPRGSMGATLEGRRSPTEQQMAYVEYLVDHFGVERPPASWSRGRVSRWIDEVKALFGA